MIDYKQLIAKAYEAQQYAYTPYSNWMVGACLLCADGSMYTGCNIESCTYTPTSCGERTAFFKAISEGQRQFVAIAIVGNDRNTPIGEGKVCAPCGVCRQVMVEFCNKDFEVILAYDYDKYEKYTLEQLFPLFPITIDKQY